MVLDFVDRTTPVAPRCAGPSERREPVGGRVSVPPSAHVLCSRPACRCLHRRPTRLGQRAICREVRDLVHAADPEVTETVKRTVQPYFVLDGNICALLAAKTHVNVFLYDGGIVPDPEGIITGGHDNKTARTVAIREGETVNARALSAMFRRIIADNRAGGWRKLKGR
ncbi:DUF1801 domain-containing protein [Nocardia xishanensis]|uniref:DUF1801 domain-containing protein n=1 Tax=Nocardia xishanensis TaxID=238964 RepID=A0ABW7WWB6_9NOCA